MATAFGSTNLPSLARRSAERSRASRVLPQYVRLEYHPLWPIAKLSIFLIAVSLAMFTGLFVAVGGTMALKFVGFPLGLFTLLILWMLPDVQHVSTPPYKKLITIYMVLMVLWPPYIAIVIPGLPWLTPPRVVLAMMLIAMLAFLPQSADARSRILSVVTHDAIAFRLYCGFMALELLTLPLSKDITGTISYVALRETLVLTPLLMAAWLFADVRNVKHMHKVLLFSSITVLLIAVVENIMQTPPWAEHIPAFMQIDPKALELILSPQARVGDQRYRIRSTFAVVLYFTQYLNLVMPLLLYSVWRLKGRMRPVGLLLIPLIIHSVWYANARTAFIALVLSFLSLAAMVVVRTMFFRRRADALHSGIMVAFVVLAMAALLGVLATSNRAKTYVFGGSVHAASNDARDQQWSNTWRHLRTNPIGVGMGNSPAYVGTTSPKVPDPVVDSLWINTLVDIGPLGFLCYYGFMLRVGWVGIITFLRADNEEEEVAGALSLGLINLFVVCYVISHADNFYLGMVSAAAVMALNRKQQIRLAEAGKANKRPVFGQPYRTALVVR